ncbi:L,D-transpeptidase family protein [Geomonas sp. RF6]|uniref:L,D-transpeptidase family protein n=1 Tax=Geomonas sp. RF6 TaxID=2897342 RepID=UPI001E44D640|nr:L,D-transpeptidase family protein [Geomonas sp. RF6]UFS71436.1 L,D-transpeptidase family protein [Geomonas sp. RF6]
MKVLSMLLHRLSVAYRQSFPHVARAASRRLQLLLFCVGLAGGVLPGCTHLKSGYQSKAAFEEADRDFGQGKFSNSVQKYEQVLLKYPKEGDRALFEMGVVYSHPRNEQKDYQKALECYSRIVADYPGSAYRQDSEMMIFYINNVIFKDGLIASQQALIERLREDVRSRGEEIGTLQKKIKELEEKITVISAPKGPADKIVVEKSARRMTLFSNGAVLKSYKIALGGNPVGAKEMQGDNKTPEGTYTIDSRKKSSQYHLSLHISYPNEEDKKRAKQLGVSPGGDIMIHGIKSGFSWVGNLHTEIDWTKGCIAVTDEEIEEIDRLVPNGTVVEIRP